MNLKSYLGSREGFLAENRWSRIVNSFLVVAVILLAVRSFMTDTVVVIKPYTLTEEAEITSSSAAASYHEAWGLFFSTLLGNVSPDSAKFIRDRVGPLLSPKIYTEVMAVIEEQSLHIENDKVVVRFEPRFVLFEAETGHVYVNGNSYIKDATTKETREESTYEFRIKIQSYQPTVEYMTLYTGKPRSEKVLKQMQDREAKIKERERKRR